MANVGTLIERMSEYLDTAGRPGADRIRVLVRRATVVKFIKPEWWGGPLKIGGREIITLDPVPRPSPPRKARKPRKPKETS